MTYEEALIDLQSIYKGHGGLYTDDSPAWELAFDALKKQIPSKPIEEWSNSPFSEDRGCKFLHLMCPNCKKMEYFCPRCGQVLDWSDEE